MTSYFLRWLVGIWFCTLAWMVCADSSASSAYPQLLSLSLPELQERLSTAEKLQVLTNAKQLIDGENRCGAFVRKAKEAREALLQANRAYYNQATPAYQQRALALKQENADAIEQYKRCFAGHLQGFQGVTAMGVNNYAAHQQTSVNFLGTLGLQAFEEIHPYMDALKSAMARLENMEKAEIIALVDAHLGEVLVQAAGTTAWAQVRRGMKLREGDRLRTGANGLLKISYDGMPTQAHLGRNSELVIAPAVRGPEYSIGVRFIRGILRALHQRSANEIPVYNINGTSYVLGVRGTEVAVTHDPASNTTKFFLSHGDAFVEAGGQRVQLQPNSHLQMQAGRLGALTPTDDFIWHTLVDLTEEKTAPPRSNTTNPEQRPTPRPRTTNPEPDNFEVNFDDFAQRMAQQRGRAAVERYLNALQNEDQAAVLDSMVDPLRGHYVKALANKSLQQLLEESGDRPYAYRFRCSYCSPDHQQCDYLVEIRKNIQVSAQFYPAWITTLKVGADFKVSNAYGKLPNMVEDFMAKGPQCSY